MQDIMERRRVPNLEISSVRECGMATPGCCCAPS